MNKAARLRGEILLAVNDLKEATLGQIQVRVSGSRAEVTRTLSALRDVGKLKVTTGNGPTVWSINKEHVTEGPKQAWPDGLEL